MVAESEILQVEVYYPFGLGHEGLGDVQLGVENAYGYNGKELNDDFGLGWNDYGARWYMADIGRWGAVDPLAEKARDWTPYRYGFNNPVKYVDPDGEFEIDPETEKQYKNLKKALKQLKKQVALMKKDDKKLKALMKWGNSIIRNKF